MENINNQKEKDSQIADDSLSIKDSKDILRLDKENDNILKYDDIIIKCTTDELVKMFLKESYIVWIDPHDNSSEYSHYVGRMNLPADVICFKNWESAIDHIQKNTFIYFIISFTSDIQSQMNKIVNLKHIHQVYVFDKDDNANIALTKPHSEKIFYNTKNFAELMIQFRKNYLIWQRHHSSWRIDLPSFAPIFNSYDLSEINYLHEYLQNLSQFNNRAKAKQDFLAISKAINNDQEDIKIFEETYDAYSMKDILYWYTKESFLYKVLNNCLRLATPDSILYCRLILKDLEQAIKDQYQATSKNYNGLVYRAAYINDAQWKSLKTNIHKDIEIHGFMSSSKNKKVASNFLGGDTRKAFFTIIIPKASDKLGTQGFSELKEFSDLPKEEEVLFNIMTRFTIISVGNIDIDGQEYRHAILLYGGYELKKWMTFNSPQIQVNYGCCDLAQLICCYCQKTYYKAKKRSWFISIYTPIRYSCFECIDKHDTKNEVMLMIPEFNLNNSQFNKIERISIPGFDIRIDNCYQLQKLEITCDSCNKSMNKGSFKCLLCNKKVCKTCLNKLKFCTQDNHHILYETNSFNLWNINFSQKESEHYKYQQEILKTKRIFIHGETYQQTNNYPKAIEYYEEFLKKINNKNDKLAIMAYDKIGQIYMTTNKPDKAIEFFDHGLVIAKRILPEKDPQILSIYTSLSNCYRIKGDFTKSQEYNSKTLEYTKDKSQTNGPNMANSLRNHAHALLDHGEYEKSIEYNLKSLELLEKKGKNTLEVSKCCEDIGFAYLDKGNINYALKYFERTLSIRETLLGEKHPETASAYSFIGGAYDEGFRHDEALKYHEKALEIRKAVFGENGPDTGFSYNDLGRVYANKCKYDKALECYEKSWKILTNTLGKENEKTLVIWNNMTGIYSNQGKLDKALECYHYGLEVTRRTLGEYHTTTCLFYHNLGTLYLEMNEFDKGLQCLKKAYENRRHFLGDKHQDTQMTLLMIQSLEAQKYGEDFEIPDYKISKEKYEGYGSVPNLNDPLNLLSQGMFESVLEGMKKKEKKHRKR